MNGYKNPTPRFETSFVDEDLRVSRDQDGKIFVYVKVSSSIVPTDFGNAPSDLGVGALLEGLAKSFF